MDVHLKSLFSRYHEQFGSGPGLGPGSGTNLTRVEGVTYPFIKSLYRAAAALYRTDPWKRLRPGHLFGVRVGKDSEWGGKKQPFHCAQFIGGDGGDVAMYMYLSETDGVGASKGRDTVVGPGSEVFRVTYEEEALMFPCHRKLIRTLALEGSRSEGGTHCFPVFDVVCGGRDGDVRYRNPVFDELRFVYGVMKGMALVHPLLQEDGAGARRWPLAACFEPFIETVDVQWPPELAKSTDVVAVTVSHPPGQAYEDSTPTKGTIDSSRDPGGFSDLNGTLRQCAVCEKEFPADRSVPCGRCRAVVYCSPSCQKLHWKDTHKSMCGLYRAMMDREEELAIKIFLFLCTADQPCRWLEYLGVHQKGMWRRRCRCYSHSPFGLLHGSDPWGPLDDGEYPRDSPIPSHQTDMISSPVILSCWSEYYTLRSLPLSSPVADILSHPLTVYYILTSLSTTSKNLLLKGKEVILHYLGPESELDWMPAFSEVGHLLNGTGNIQIVMVGPAVPPSLSGTTSGIGSRVRINLVRGLYQDEVPYLPTPHVVVGLNCGLDGCVSWNGALETVKSTGVASFFTDQSEIACNNAKQVLRSVGLHISHPVTPNPFRSPVRSYGGSTNVPSYSNCFLLGVNT